jgi:hypothetical protein
MGLSFLLLWLLVRFGFGYEGNLLGVYHEQLSAQDVGRNFFLETVGLYPYYFILACGILPMMAAILFFPKWNRENRQFFLLMMGSTMVVMIGTAWAVNRSEYTRYLFMRYSDMYLPLVLIACLFPEREDLPADPERKRSAKALILPLILIVYTVVCTIAWGSTVGAGSALDNHFMMSLASMMLENIEGISAVLIFILCGASLFFIGWNPNRKATAVFCTAVFAVACLANNAAGYSISRSNTSFKYGEEARRTQKDLIRGEDADEIMEYLEKQAERISAMLPEGLSREAYFFTAQDTVPYYENDAFVFRRITTQDTVIDAQAAKAKAETDILEDRSGEARVTGVLEEGDLVYVIEGAGEGWLFVESGDVRGFVRSSDLDRSGSVQAQIDEEGESSFSLAAEKIEPSENKATYYSLASVKEGTKYNEVREKILDMALSCVGNPYVWGGTSLTHGADCSGFVQTLYSMFGYKLPRVAAAQSTVGTQIPVSDAAPGDLIFFARNGYVYHVAMYAGDGKTVEAYSSQYGIITKELSDRDAVWATRIIED